jgi:hypothetical protein
MHGPIYRVVAFCAVLGGFGAGSIAHAGLVQFDFTTTVTTSAIPGVSPGTTVAITLLADNGNSGLNSQSWLISDLISGSLAAGTYTQSYSDGWFSAPSHLAFTTNGSGILTLSQFFGTTNSPNHQDTFGMGPQVYLASNAAIDFFGRTAFFQHNTSTLSRWTVSEVGEVPEPASLTLLSLGAIGLAGAARRRRQAA